MYKGFSGFGEGNVLAFCWAEGDAFFRGRVRKEWGCGGTDFADCEKKSTMRLAVLVNVVGAVRGGVNSDAVGIVGRVCGERWAKCW